MAFKVVEVGLVESENSRSQLVEAEAPFCGISSATSDLELTSRSYFVRSLSKR